MKRHQWMIKDKTRPWMQNCMNCSAIRTLQIHGPTQAFDPENMMPKRWCGDQDIEESN